MEELLNKLIEKGWKPFGNSRIEEINRAEQYVGNWNWCCWGGAMQKRKSTRQLVSRESLLWQFVCENGMVEKGGLFWELGYSSGEIDLESRVRRQDYEYRLIQSALCDEDKLEDFILSNIKVDAI